MTKQKLPKVQLGSIVKAFSKGSKATKGSKVLKKIVGNAKPTKRTTNAISKIKQGDKPTLNKSVGKKETDTKRIAAHHDKLIKKQNKIGGRMAAAMQVGLPVTAVALGKAGFDSLAKKLDKKKVEKKKKSADYKFGKGNYKF